MYLANTYLQRDKEKKNQPQAFTLDPTALLQSFVWHQQFWHQDKTGSNTPGLSSNTEQLTR